MVDLVFYGVACFKITTEKGLKVWIDPYITENKHCPIKRNDIKEADIVLVSHSAFDHIGENPDGTYDAFEIVNKTGALLVAPADVTAMARRNNVPDNQIKEAAMFLGEVLYKGIRIKGIESHHTHNIARTNGGFTLGIAQGFLLTLENDVRIYHSGDTCTFLDLKSVGEFYRPNIMMLESGASRPTDMPVTNPFEVATVVRWIGPDVFIPIHDPYRVFTEKVIEYVKAATPYVQVLDMKPGDAIRYRPYHVEKI
jgi:L-ascorbate metabolism protein UlaG (beta-lactamase superfamily)